MTINFKIKKKKKLHEHIKSKHPMGHWWNQRGNEKKIHGDKNWNTTIQNLWNAANAVQRGKCRVIQNYLKKQTKISTIWP